MKPLTEDVVLTAIRDFLEAADTDARAESKPWPKRRPDGYAVGMRGHWTIKLTEPKKIVEKAEQIECLKPLVRADRAEQRVQKGSYNTNN